LPFSAPRLRPRFGTGGAGVAGSSFSARDLGSFFLAGWLSAASSDALASTSSAVGPSSSVFFARERFGLGFPAASASAAAAVLSTPVSSAAVSAAGFLRERFGLGSGWAAASCSACAALASATSTSAFSPSAGLPF